ncbi:MAG: hypothetical protein OXF29_02460 [Hyphomicrobiales bacterium]|nr:hypothetical protein [Hyphomicrobiales bacterium]
MKTMLTTIFAIAVMVFVFKTGAAYATEESDQKAEDFLYPPSQGTGCVDQFTGAIMEGTTNCDQYSEIDSLNELDGAGKEVADSGNEGNTSAAQESDQ